MTSKKPEDASPSDNETENNQPTDDQSPEAIAAAAIDAAKAKAKGSDAEALNSSETQIPTEEDANPKAAADTAPETDGSGADGNDSDASQGSEESVSNAADDPLGFDDARMPDSDDKVVDFSAEAGNETDGVEVQLAAANAKVDEHWNRILRMQADLENERKRAQKQVANAHKFAIEGFVNELLPIKDSLEMGLVAARADDADLTKIVEGSELTLKLLVQAFEKNQISEVDPMDQKFDPNVHQAMSMQEAEGKEPNTVIGVMQKGYTLNDRLIRPALVTVSK